MILHFIGYIRTSHVSLSAFTTNICYYAENILASHSAAVYLNLEPHSLSIINLERTKRYLSWLTSHA